MYVRSAFATESKVINNAKFIGAFDTSGSMVGGRFSTLFTALKQLELTYDSLHTWCDKLDLSRNKARIVIDGSAVGAMVGHNNQIIKCGGGTDPNCLLKTTTFTTAATGDEILIFSTDGEIDNNLLKNFSKNMKKSFSLVVCIIVGENNRDMKNVNMSVVSPFLSSPNVCVFLSPNGCKLLSSTLPQFETTSTATNTRQLPDILLKDVMRGKIRECLPAEEDDVLIGDQYVKLSKLSSFTLEDFTKLDFSALTLRMKTQGSLSNLRSALKNLQSTLTISSSARLGEMEETAVMQAIAADPDAPNIDELRDYLRKLRMERYAKQYEQNKRGAVDVAVRNNNKLIAEWMVVINEIESAGYTADEMNKIASNRIRRLNNMADPDAAWNYTGAFRQTCKICAAGPENDAPESGVMSVMLLDKPSNDNRLTEELCISDFYVTFPLAFDKLVISPWRVCISCAQCLSNNGLDPNRQRIIGFIPIVDISKNNKVFSYRINCLIGAGKKCYHTYKVLYAALEVLGTTDWGNKPKFAMLCKFMQDQIYHNCRDRIGMKEAGAVVSMDKVFVGMLKQEQEDNLLSQPFYSAMIVLHRAPQTFSDRARYLAQKSFIRHLVERYNTYLKNPDGRTTKRKIRAELFEAPHGIPVLETARIVSFENSEALGELCDNLKYVRYLLLKDGITINDALYTAVLACICSLGTHDKLETQLYLLLSKSSTFMSVYDRGLAPDTTTILAVVKDSLLLNPRHLDDIHRETIPPFITPAGPSKVVCSCGVRFDTQGQQSIDEVRKAHFEKVHGSYLPTMNSSHFNLHAAIRGVMAKHPQATKPTRELVVEVLADLYRRKKGNIYISEMCHNVVVALRSYFQAKLRFPEIHPMNDDATAIIKRFPQLAYHCGPRGAHGTNLLVQLELNETKPEYYQIDLSHDAVLEAPFTEQDWLLFNAVHKH